MQQQPQLPDLGRLCLVSPTRAGGNSWARLGGKGGQRPAKLPHATHYLDSFERETFFSLIEKIPNPNRGNWRDTSLFKAFEALLGGWRGMYTPKPEAEIFVTIERFFDWYLAPLGVNAAAPSMDSMTAQDLKEYYVGTWTSALFELSKKEDYDEYAIRDKDEVDHLFATIVFMVKLHADRVPGWTQKAWDIDVQAMHRLFIGRTDDRQQLLASGTTFYDRCKLFEDTYLKPFNIYGEALQKYANRFGPEQLCQLFYDWTAVVDRYARTHHPDRSGANHL